MLEIDEVITTRSHDEIHWYYYLMGCLDEIKILLKQEDAYMKKKNEGDVEISAPEELYHLAFCRMLENEKLAYLAQYIRDDRRMKIESLTMRIWKEGEYWFPC